MKDSAPEKLRALATSKPRPRPLVFVTVGSDHHPFDRLVSWVDAWAARNDVDCVVQYGTAQPPRSVHAVPYLDKDLLELLLESADVAVAQGGPMSIIEARRAGLVPVVVAREPRLGEVVDGHQVAFCDKLGGQGLIRNAADETTLHAHLDHALRWPESMRAETDPASLERALRAIHHLGRTAHDLVLRDHEEPGQMPRVLLLGGAGRSGSTLVERMLGAVDGVHELGETLHLWERGLRDDELCGCELPFSQCPFWIKVGDVAFDGWGNLPGEDMVALRRHVVRSRHSLGLLAFSPNTGWRLERDRLIRTVGAMYRAAAEVGSAELLVDSSKHPAYAMLLRRAQVDLRCVLVVRDPRAVAHSWSRSVRRPEVVGEVRDMPRYPVTRTAFAWQFYAAMYQALGVVGVPVMAVRYEDLLADPRGVVGRVLEFAGLDAHTVSDAIGKTEVRLGHSHTVAGNPMRFQVGTVPLVLDERWRTEMTPRNQRLVGLLTALGRRWYGYR